MEQIEWTCFVLANQSLSETFSVLTLSCEAISQKALPGQFVNVSCLEFLRRPFGILSVDRQSGSFKIGIERKGKGSVQLATLNPGQQVSVLGPLGHGFEMDGLDQIITVGGGTGVFPLYFALQTARERGIKSVAVCGYRSRSDAILIDEFRSLSDQCILASDTGGLDVQGHAGFALSQVLNQKADFSKTAILTCGPKVMMQEVARQAAAMGINCQVSLEERMACGIGVCLVCVCKIKAKESETINHQRCCVEGPVFKAEEVIW